MSSNDKISIRGTLHVFDKSGTIDQAALLTLPLLILYVDDHWYIKIPIVIASLLGLFFSPLRNSSYLWFILACFMGAGVFYNWQAADNHKYLITYWCTAIFLTQFFNTGEHALKISARYLVGLAFLFAAIWKVITPDFLNGDFFEYTFLFDERFRDKLETFGLLHNEASKFNTLAREALVVYDSQFTTVDLLTSYPLKILADTMVWWTMALEGLVTILFLLPAKYRITQWGDILLVVFLLTTYLIAPVIGFGWVIGTMAFTQCDKSRWKMRVVYLFTILFLQLYRFPWASIADVVLD